MDKLQIVATIIAIVVAIFLVVKLTKRHKTDSHDSLGSTGETVITLPPNVTNLVVTQKPDVQLDPIERTPVVPPVVVPAVSAPDDPQPGETFLHWLLRVHPENGPISAALAYQTSSYQSIVHGNWKIAYEMAMQERKPAPQPGERRVGDIPAPAVDELDQWCWILLHPQLWNRLDGEAAYINNMQVYAFYHSLAGFKAGTYTGPRWGV